MGKPHYLIRISSASKQQTPIGNGNGSSILAHDFVDVRSKGNLASNGNEIFNSGGYGGS